MFEREGEDGQKSQVKLVGKRMKGEARYTRQQVDRDLENQRQEQHNHIQDSKCNPWYKRLLTGDRPFYLRSKEDKDLFGVAELRLAGHSYWEK